ncbi:MAG: hypothetical protein RI963_2174 [Planctomycetota bacterium]
MKRGRNVFWGYVVAAALLGVISIFFLLKMAVPRGTSLRPASSEPLLPPSLEPPHAETIQTPYSEQTPYSDTLETPHAETWRRSGPGSGVRYSDKLETPFPPLPSPIERPMVERSKGTYVRPIKPPSQAPSSALADHFRAIDEILASLEWGNIAFNTPQSMNLGDTAIIQLVLGLDTEIEDLKQKIEAKGEKEGASIRVSDRMEARLSGPNFAITAIAPEIQPVSKSESTNWEWEVKPQGQGHQNLHLTLSALIEVDGTSTLKLIRTFSRDIEVEVTRRQWIAAFLEKNWQWLWTAALVPIAGWLWSRRKGKGNDTRSDQPQGQSSQETRGGNPGENG